MRVKVLAFDNFIVPFQHKFIYSFIKYLDEHLLWAKQL